MGEPTTTPADGTTAERSSEDYVNLGRSVLTNHLETEKNKTRAPSTLYRITDFVSKRIWSWLYYYADSRFGRNHPYPDYTSAPDNGVYRISPGEETEEIVIGLCADWATNTRQSVQIAQSMATHAPDYTIHLGDIYFVGEPKEVKRNFLDAGSPWVRGARGSFAVLGNHEMYARGIAFFDHLLPSLGLRTGSTYQGQHAGFVCLETDYWRILVLDTGYHSIGKVPVLEMIPWFAPDSRLDPKLMEWLKNEVRLGDASDKRGLVFMTHHQYITAFRESEYPKPAAQLASLIGTTRPVIWIWGHEHKFAMYGKAQVSQGVTAFGRCIGHGGMPVEVDSFRRKASAKGADKLTVYDSRVHRTRLRRKIPLGYNGYAVLRLKANTLSVEYRDFYQSLLTETWTVSAEGEISGSIQPAPDCPIAPVEGKRWEDAVAGT
jgi:hypothetical protein